MPTLAMVCMQCEDGSAVELRANHLLNPTDKIVLEPAVIEEMNAFFAACKSGAYYEKI